MIKFPQNLKICYPLIIKVFCADNDRTFSSGVRLDSVLILVFYDFILAKYLLFVNDLTL